MKQFTNPEFSPETQNLNQIVPNHEILSRREKEIMLALAGGKTVTEIARGASLSVKTVSTYRTRLLRKMGFKTNHDIVHYARSSKLIA